MNFGPLRIGQNLFCMLTAGKAGLIWWGPPGPGFIRTGLKLGLPGPSLRLLPPCNGKPTFGCARFGLNFWAFGLTCWKLGLLSRTLGLTCWRLGLLSRTLGLTCCRLGLLSRTLGLTCCRLGLLRRTLGLTCCRLGLLRRTLG